LPIDLIALFVDSAVMPATEQGEIRERGGAPLGPVTEVMALDEAGSAPREATAVVSMIQGSPDRRRNRPGPGGYFHDTTVPAVPHDYAARIARQSPRRFRGNVCAVLQDGLAGRIGIRENRGVDVDHDLVAVRRSTRIDPVVQRCLGQRRQRVSLLLGHRGRFRGNVR